MAEGMEAQDAREEERLTQVFTDLYSHGLYSPFRSLPGGRAKESFNFYDICVQGTGFQVLLLHTQQ